MPPKDTLAPLTSASRDYERMADALAFLGDHWRDRPTYEDVARQAGLSPHHFHRIFTRWAGVSPKRLVDAYAHAEARSLLDEGASVLETSLDVGLSGPSRLHDLFIAFEAATPGDAKRKGEGLDFSWGCAPTPFGDGVFLISPRGLSALAFSDEVGEEAAFADLECRYPAARYVRDDAEAEAYARRVFLSDEPTPLALFGTEFQRQVWRALIDIPPGATTSYGALASSLGAPSAARAVGTAVGRNPVSFLIPCHRVIASDGRLTGYHWGIRRKRAMLAFEAARAEEGANVAEHETF